MRLTILAIGSARGTSEGALCDEFRDRAVKLGRNMGFTQVAVEELNAGKARDAATRMTDEAARLVGKSARRRPCRFCWTPRARA